MMLKSIVILTTIIDHIMIKQPDENEHTRRYGDGEIRRDMGDADDGARNSGRN